MTLLSSFLVYSAIFLLLEISDFGGQNQPIPYIEGFPACSLNSFVLYERLSSKLPRQHLTRPYDVRIVVM